MLFATCHYDENIKFVLMSKVITKYILMKFHRICNAYYASIKHFSILVSEKFFDENNN